MRPLVSVIIPCFNAERYIADAIESARSQTWDNIEIIMIDDESNDGSAKIAQTYQSARLKLFKQLRSGASAARNEGLRRAQGEYIQFLDADDVMAPEKI